MHNLTNSAQAQTNIATMAFTKETTARFASAYEAAKAGNKPEFVFGGVPFMTQYAKYLLEYLRGAYGV